MELLKRIQELLKTKDVTASFDEDGDLLFMAMAGCINVRIFIRVTDAAISVRAFFPVFVPVARRQEIYEAISLANFNLKLARFEMDTDGEIRCRADMPLYDSVPTDKQLTRLIYSVWNISEIYGEALLEVMTTQTDASLAIARVEAAPTEPARRTQVPDLNVN